MRILHCISSMEGGGAERQLAYLAGELGLRGCDVHVALTHKGAHFDRLRSAGATIHNLGPCGHHDPRLLLRLIRTIRRVRPDLVQCWLIQMEIVGGVAALATNTPWLFSERSSSGAYGATVKTLVRRRIACFADGIVANSQGGKRYWEGRVGPAVPMHVVNNGLPLEEIDAVPAATPDDMGAEANEPTILYAGRFDEGKNALTLVAALHRVGTVARFHALFCGDGPLRADVERVVAAGPLARRIQITSFAANLWALLKAAGMLVSVSRFEGSPNVVLEAMACRCPLVVSDIPAHRELLDERSAVFVDAGDPDDIARAITAVLSDPSAARQRANGARERAERHALPDMAQQYLGVYHDVLSRARGQTRMTS